MCLLYLKWCSLCPLNLWRKCCFYVHQLMLSSPRCPLNLWHNFVFHAPQMVLSGPRCLLSLGPNVSAHKSPMVLLSQGVWPTSIVYEPQMVLRAAVSVEPLAQLILLCTSNGAIKPAVSIETMVHMCLLFPPPPRVWVLVLIHTASLPPPLSSLLLRFSSHQVTPLQVNSAQATSHQATSPQVSQLHVPSHQMPQRRGGRTLLNRAAPPHLK